jgi:mannan endo-1,4-beta-mannosidase
VAARALVALAWCALAACGGGGTATPATGVAPPSEAPVTATPPSGWMRVAQGELRSASGHAVLLRGINLQYGDWPEGRLAGLAAIADQGANAVRLQLRRDTTAAQLRAALDELLARGMVAIPMYWETDVTCTHDTQGLATAMTRWTQTWREVLLDSRYRGMLVVNIANEWGSSAQLADWRSRMAAAITQLREAGLAMPLMIDAPDCGQLATAFDSATVAAWLAADPYDNLVLSVHAYWRYQTAALITEAVDQVRAQGLPMVWGEFGQRAFQADSGHATDHLALMRDANRRSVGYLAWSWYGNGPEAAVLDMATQISGGELTAYGREVVEGATLDGEPVAGLRATSQRLMP